MEYNVIVVGSGPAGAEVARRLGENGKRTALITDTPPGGRATVGSLLPSKVWLHTVLEHKTDDAARVQEAAASVRQTIEQRTTNVKDELTAAGVEVIVGNAKFTGEHQVTVTGESSETVLTADFLVFATGSEPRFFPNVKPDGKRVLAPRFTKMLQERPDSLVMVGGGVTGVEYSSVFARMGTEVTLITDVERILPPFDREYSIRLQEELGALGVNLELNAPVKSVSVSDGRVYTETVGGQTFESQYGFVATGRLGDLTFLTEGGPHLDSHKGFLVVDDLGKTSLDYVYACGDITGLPLTANKALLEARSVVDAILGRTHSAPARDSLTQAVYTTPEFAQIGPVLDLAERDDVVLQRRSYRPSMASLVHGTGSGELKIWVDPKDKRILGAAALGEHAADVMAVVQVAMHNGLSVEAVTETPFAYPSTAEVLSL